jgi:hypothetical protein
MCEMQRDRRLQIFKLLAERWSGVKRRMLFRIVRCRRPDELNSAITA